MKKILSVLVVALLLTGCSKIPFLNKEEETIDLYKESSEVFKEGNLIPYELGAEPKSEDEFNGLSEFNKILETAPEFLTKYFDHKVAVDSSKDAKPRVFINKPTEEGIELTENEIVQLKQKATFLVTSVYQMQDPYVVYSLLAELLYHYENIDKNAEWIDIYETEWKFSDTHGSKSPMNAFSETVTGYYFGNVGHFKGVGLEDKPMSIEFLEKIINYASEEDREKTLNEISERVKRVKSAAQFKTETISNLTLEHSNIGENTIHEKIKKGAKLTVFELQHYTLKETWVKVQYDGSFYWTKFKRNEMTNLLGSKKAYQEYMETYEAPKGLDEVEDTKENDE